MKGNHIALTLALLTAGLVPLGSAQADTGSMPAGIEVITVVGKRPVPEAGIEVITVVGKRPAQTLASTCVNEVIAGRVAGRRNAGDSVAVQAVDAQTQELRQASRNRVHAAIEACIEQAQTGAARS